MFTARRHQRCKSGGGGRGGGCGGCGVEGIIANMINATCSSSGGLIIPPLMCSRSTDAVFCLSQFNASIKNPNGVFD